MARVLTSLGILATLVLVGGPAAWASPVSSPYNSWYLGNATTSAGGGSAAYLDSSTSTSFGVGVAAVLSVPTTTPPSWLVEVTSCNGSRDDSQTSYYWGGSSGHGAGNMQMTYSSSYCGGTIHVAYGLQQASSTPSGASVNIAIPWGEYDIQYGAAPPAAIATCTAAQVSDLRVGYDGTNWTVRFHQAVSSSYTFRLDAPDPNQYLGTAITTMTAAGDGVDGSPGYVYAKHTGSSAASAAVTVMNGATPVCQAHAGVYAGAVTPAGGSVGATNPDDPSADCGLNPFCYIKAALTWAFVPDSTKVDDAKALGSSLATVVPWGYMVKAWTFAHETLTAVEACEGDGGVSSCPSVCPGGCALTVHMPPMLTGGGLDPDLGHTPVSAQVLPEGSAGMTVLQDLRPVLAAVMWLLVLLPLAFWLFRKLAPGGGDE